MPLVLTLGTPFRESFLLKPGPMGGVRLLAVPAKAKTTELLCKGPRGMKGHGFGGSGRAWGRLWAGRGPGRDPPSQPHAPWGNLRGPTLDIVGPGELPVQSGPGGGVRGGHGGCCCA